MGADINFKNKYNKAKGWRKFFMFNAYALAGAFVFFIAYRLISWIISLTDTSLSLNEIWVDILVALAWGYITAILFLQTKFLKRTSRKKLTNNK